MLQSFWDAPRRWRPLPDTRIGASPLLSGAAETAPVRVVTYNIHKCVGVDGRYDPARVVAVLREIHADIACLQEVGARRGIERYSDQWSYLGEATGCRVILGTGIRDHRGRFGNAILTRFPILAARSIDLTVAGHEPRGAIDADLLAGDRVLRVIATHFGLRAAERRLQANRLMTLLGETSTVGRREADAVLLMGDLNEWRGRSGAIRAFDRRLGPSAAERTFPSWMPVLALDRIYADGPAVLHGVSVYRSPLARLASDHLPLVGTLSWDGHGLWRRDPPRLPRGKRRSRPSVSTARAEKHASGAVATRRGQQSL